MPAGALVTLPLSAVESSRSAMITRECAAMPPSSPIVVEPGYAEQPFAVDIRKVYDCELAATGATCSRCSTI